MNGSNTTNIPPLYGNLNQTQTNVLKFSPIPSALLSVFGSCLILFHVVVGKRLKKSYHRIMMGLSIADICFSLPLAFIPPLTYPILDATSPECKADGFLYFFNTSSYLYAASLSTYYILVVRYSVNDQRLSKYYEPFFHIISISWPLAIAIYGLITNAAGLSSPKFGCTTFAGDNKFFFLIFGSSLPLFSSLLTTIINNLRLYLHVRGLENKTRGRYSNNNNSGRQMRRGSTLSIQSDEFSADGLEEGMERSLFCGLSCGCCKRDAEPSKAARVAGQAILYLWAFLGALVGTIALVIVYSVDKENVETGKYFPLQVLEAVITPTQGFLNCFVFFRPRYLRWRKHNPTESRWFAFRKAAFSLEDPRFVPAVNNKASCTQSSGDLF